MSGNSVKNQYLATIYTNIITISYGAACGWPSASFLILKTNETPLPSGPLTTDQLSWVGSLLCVGGLLGNIFFGWCSNNYSRKMLLMILPIPQIASWLFIIFAKNVIYLYISRFLAGCAGGGSLMMVPLFVTEISEDKIRGTLGSILVLSCNIGILAAFTFGNYFDYMIVLYILMTLPIVFLIGIIFFPETPIFLLKNNKEEDAEKSIKFYRNIKSKDIYHSGSDLLKSEMDKLRSHLKAEKLDKYVDNKLSLNDFTNPIARKAFLIGICLVALNQFCGIFAMLNYTATIFAEAGTDLTPNMSAIIVGIIQLIGSYFSTILVDRTGRKFLLAISSAGIGFGLSCLGLYSLLKLNSHYSLESYGWIPIVCFAFSVFIASWGVLTLPFVVIAEIMPEKIRSFGTSFCISNLWIFAFIMVKYFPILNELIGMHGCMFIFAGCSFAGTIFILLVLPETKGKSFEAIMQSLAGK